MRDIFSHRCAPSSLFDLFALTGDDYIHWRAAAMLLLVVVVSGVASYRAGLQDEEALRGVLWNTLPEEAAPAGV